MAKPIFVIELPSHIKREELKKMLNDFETQMPDYHVIMFIGGFEIETKFQCFNSTDADEIKFKELQKLINDRIK